MANSKASHETVNPGDRVRLYAGVSCVTFIKNGEYGMRGTNFFDAPQEDYIEGNLTGLKMALEVMAAARNGNFDAFKSVLEAAVKTSIPTKDNPIGTMSGSGAACGFLFAISGILELAAQKLDLNEFMAHSFKAQEDVIEDNLRDLKAENKAFIATMTTKSKAVAHG